jgi:hypothetical protein
MATDVAACGAQRRTSRTAIYHIADAVIGNMRANGDMGHPEAGDGVSNRDRGEPHGSAPPTPPCVRVRTRRFGRLIGLLGTREVRPSAASEALGNARVRAGCC